MASFYKPKTKTGDLINFPQVLHPILILTGAWHIEGDGQTLKTILYTLNGYIVCLSMLVVWGGETSSFFANTDDVIKAAQSLCPSIFAAFVCLRYLYLRILSHKFRMIMTVFAEEIWIDGEKYPRNVRKCHQFMRPAFVLFILIVVTWISYSILPIIVFFDTHQTLDSQDKMMPYPMEFPYDVQKPISYIITYIITLYGAWGIVAQFYVYDAVILLFVTYLCGQLDILHGDIVRLIPECYAEWQNRYSKNENVSRNYDVQWQTGHVHVLQAMYTKRLHQLCARHSQLISFCNRLNDLFGIPLLLNVTLSTFLVCLSGFQFLISGISSLTEFMMFSSFFFALLLQLFIICNCGTLLISTSSDTVSYLYMCIWEGGQLSEASPLLHLSKDVDADSLNVKLPLWRSIIYYPTDKDFRNKLRFMIMRSHRPLELSAMNFTVVSLECFATIISSSMSYFALLKNFLEE